MMGDNAHQPAVILRDSLTNRWLRFQEPVAILTTEAVEEVLPLLEEVEKRVSAEALHAAGWIAYEAAPAFDPALPAKEVRGFPLLWFGLFKTVEETQFPVEEKEQNIRWTPSVTQGEYEKGMARILHYIGQGDCYQVNHTYRLHGDTPIDPWAMFTQGAADAPFAAYVDTGRRVACSFSPELFFRLDGNVLESRPMKGTAPRGLSCEEDAALKDSLCRSEKERAENLMILDMARNDLGHVAKTGTVSVPAFLTAEKYPTVWQLTSTVRVRTDASIREILQASFPPASITGAPKKRAMEIIREVESTPRKLYTGAIGYIAPGRRAQFNVAIRTLVTDRETEKSEYGTGGGITADSSPRAEFEEALVKTKVVRGRLPEFDLLETILWEPGSGYALLEEHLLRLSRSADYFGYALDCDAVRRKLEAVAQTLRETPQRLRMLASRIGGTEITANPLPADFRGFGDLTLARNPVDSRNVFLYHKTTCRRAYEGALAASPGSPDVLLHNERGELTESTIANIAVELQGVLYTPPVRCGLLAGTLRGKMLEEGTLHERVLTLDDVVKTGKVYLLNSVRGLHEVRVLK
jgi:para-aminobenzoate synthetase/4-amino-4-deoxychorismate lyase